MNTILYNNNISQDLLISDAFRYSISVNGNWRLTFKFENEDAILVDYQDYH